MGKPSIETIVTAYIKTGLHSHCETPLEVSSVVGFFEWAYNEGRKDKEEPPDENCTCSGSCKGNSTHHRKPTKMELATT